MPFITTCSVCGHAYEEVSEEYANTRPAYCPKHEPRKHLLVCPTYHCRNGGITKVVTAWDEELETVYCGYCDKPLSPLIRKEQD